MKKIVEIDSCNAGQCRYNACVACLHPSLGHIRHFSKEEGMGENDFPTWCPLDDAEEMTDKYLPEQDMED